MVIPSPLHYLHLVIPRVICVQLYHIIRETFPKKKKDAWKQRAECSNERPLSGEFSSIPRTLVQNNQNTDGVLRKVLKKDYETTRQKINKAFQRTTNPPSLYAIQEHIYFWIFR